MTRFGIFLIAMLALMAGCQEEEPELQELAIPTNLTVNVSVASDQSGNVTVTPQSDNSLYYHVFFIPGNDPVVISAGESAQFRFTRSGQYSTPVTVVAYSAGGLSSSTTV